MEHVTSGKPYVSPSEAVAKFQKKYTSEPRQEIQIVRTSAAMDTPDNQPRPLPTPWLGDSEWLLAELTKTRETILRIPFRLDNQSDIQSAIDRVWRLERTLRDLLHYHRDGQRSFAKQAEERSADTAEHGRTKGSGPHRPKVVRMRA